MKQFLTSFLVMCSYVLCGAQATTLVVDNQTPGWLSSKIDYGDQLTVENLTVTGYINGTDLKFIHELNKNRQLNGIIDLSNVSIISGGEAYKNNQFVIEDFSISNNMFVMTNTVQKIILPKSTKQIVYDLMSGKETFMNIDTLIVCCPHAQSIGGFRDIKYLELCEGIDTVDFGYGFGQSDSQTIILPSTITNIASNLYFDKGTIISYVLDPTKISGGNFRSGNIYIPAGTIELYKKSLFMSMTIIENIYPEKLEFETSMNDIFIGDKFQIKYSITPSNSIHNDLMWQSSDNNIAKVENDGIITGLSYGQSIISATTINNVEASCVVNVYEHVTSISLPTSFNINVSEKKQIVPEIFPIGKTDGKVFWESSDQNIATVDENGYIKGVSKGACTITATTSDGGLSARCHVPVIQPVESVTVTPNNISISVGDNSRLTVIVLPTNANDKSVTWESSDESIATVDNQGKVTAVRGGEAKITVRSVENSDIKDECTVTVLQPTTGVSLDKSEIEIIEDESIQLIATVLPENASNKSVNWTSSDISVAMVSPDGTVYALKAGQATIMATTVDGGFVALCKVTVKSKTIMISNIELSSNSESIAVGETLQLNAIISPDNASNKAVNWTSTNPSIASVNSSGLVSAIAEGKTQIIATTTDGSNLSAICEINVTKQFITVSQIQITPSSARIPIGQTLNLSAEITPDDATNKAIKWSSTDPAIAIVSESGVVSAISEGNAIIIASTQDGSNLSATCFVIVSHEAGIDSITTDKESYVKVFSLSGYLIYEGVYSEAKLTPGFYIVICNGASYKTKVD